MRPLAPFDCAAFSELVDLCRIHAERGAGPFKANGSFIQETRNGAKQLYWYYRGYAKTSDGSPGVATKAYVGPVGDETIEAIVAEHAQRKASYLGRRNLAARLKRAGLPAPHRIEGAVVGALQAAGVLADSVIVGSAAFQTYGGLLGVRLDASRYRTLDLDVAQPRGLRLAPGGTGGEDFLEALRKADPTFAPDYHANEPKLIAGFRNATNFRLEFLMPQASGRTGHGRLVAVAGVPGVGAQQLRFLEFSLTNTVQSVMLHEAGILVTVPHPARFAVHKLIVAALRSAGGPSDNVSKAPKDVLQAEDLIDGLVHVRDAVSLGRAWLDAWSMGPQWRKALRLGTSRLDDGHLLALRAAVDEAAATDGVVSPFELHEDARKALGNAGAPPPRR